jgi:hypothetical protein
MWDPAFFRLFLEKYKGKVHFLRKKVISLAQEGNFPCSASEEQKNKKLHILKFGREFRRKSNAPGFPFRGRTASKSRIPAAERAGWCFFVVFIFFRKS